MEVRVGDVIINIDNPKAKQAENLCAGFANQIQAVLSLGNATPYFLQILNKHLREATLEIKTILEILEQQTY
jgi:hypothetical protein